MRTSLRAPALLSALVLSGCAVTIMSKVDSGETVVKDRLAVQVASPWNKFERGDADNTTTWTVDGVTVDALQFYVGVKDGELIAPTPSSGKGREPLAFKSSMQTADIVALYRSLFTRDGSAFTLDKLEVAEFVGTRGFRLEYSLVRKVDDVRLKGLAYGAVRNGELFLINYSAPRLAFYPKNVAQVEALAKSARVKG
jgi:hypothetical protein